MNRAKIETEVLGRSKFGKHQLSPGSTILSQGLQVSGSGLGHSQDSVQSWLGCREKAGAHSGPHLKAVAG